MGTDIAHGADALLPPLSEHMVVDIWRDCGDGVAELRTTALPAPAADFTAVLTLLASGVAWCFADDTDLP